MAIQNNKVVYSSTSDFLQYLTARTKEKEKSNGKFSLKDVKKRESNNSSSRYN
ncbi:MAG: hypothetical protein H7263_11745 [Candidatus Sericytochromatia bacterium]|nr:hypothetical protein [Candidatus Sericytochromatia bacterium]